ncbi:DEKNAAC104908 [Brettanomyces naardenensis]|uniref:DEKNAAC104909 n=1 Tax=Brettanomyces naardenensis TaxID=13370 RepID=A0A448YSI0_BRENA|nr:DEKNAAC104908 [Brettanomyces naardenensis]
MSDQESQSGLTLKEDYDYVEAGYLESSGKDNKSVAKHAKRRYKFQRAEVACVECRKAKTRCNYVKNGTSCFRCENLSLKCSLGKKRGKQVTVSNFQKTAELSKRQESHSIVHQRKKRKLSQDDEQSDELVMGSSDPNDLHSSLTQFQALSRSHFEILSSKLERISTQLDSLVESTINDGNTTEEELEEAGEKIESDVSGSIPTHSDELIANPNIYSSLVPFIPFGQQMEYPAGQLSPDQAPTFLINPNRSGEESTLHQQADDAPIVTINSDKSSSTSSHSSQVSVSRTDQEPDPFFFTETPCSDMQRVEAFLGLPLSSSFRTKTDYSVLKQTYAKFDIISRKLSDYETFARLIEVCRLHYQQFLPLSVGANVRQWLDVMRFRCPLLLDTYILLGLRHCVPEIGHISGLEIPLVQTVFQLLTISMCEVPQSKEFLECICLLSQFSMSLSYQRLPFDGWWLTSYGLLHIFSKEIGLTFFLDAGSPAEKIESSRLLNCMMLGHLSHCIFTGKPCMIDGQMLHKCRYSLNLSEMSPADIRISAEFSILLVLYEQLRAKEPLRVSLKLLQDTVNGFNYIGDSRISSCIRIKYNFARVMLTRRYIMRNAHRKGEKDFESFLTQMINDGTEISTVAMRLDNNMLSNWSDIDLFIIFLNSFFLLGIKKMGLISEVNGDVLIIDCCNKFLQCCEIIQKNQARSCNGFILQLSSIIAGFKGVLFPGT